MPLPDPRLLFDYCCARLGIDPEDERGMTTTEVAVITFLLVGAAIGPRALDLIPDSDAARHLAEFGVVFLMFSIGLEFSLPKLYAMKRIVFGLGLLQVIVSMLLITALVMLAGINWQPVSYTHLRAHETPEHLVCRLLLEKKHNTHQTITTQR